jgi:hypothetical protein
VGSLVPSRAVPQAGAAPVPAAMVVADGSDRWAAAGAISGAACLGAGVVAVVLRGRRFTRD